MPVSFPVLNPSTGQLDSQDFFTVGEVAELLHMSHSTVRRRIKSGRWPYFAPVPGAFYLSAQDVGYVVELLHHHPDPGPCDGHDTPPRLGIPLSDSDLEPME